MKPVLSHLLALDIDGTLLTSDKKLTKRTACALKNAIAKNFAVILATGRPFAGIPDELPEFPGIRYAITSNGAVTTDLAADLNIPRDRIIAIGDDENDLGMLKVAGMSVAMGNADELLTGAASFVTASNDREGVAKAVEKFKKKSCCSYRRGQYNDNYVCNKSGE